MPDNAVDRRRGTYRRIYDGFVDGRRINSVSIEAEALLEGEKADGASVENADELARAMLGLRGR